MAPAKTRRRGGGVLLFIMMVSIRINNERPRLHCGPLNRSAVACARLICLWSGPCRDSRGALLLHAPEICVYIVVGDISHIHVWSTQYEVHGISL
jgi:hypothetical protein